MRRRASNTRNGRSAEALGGHSGSASRHSLRCTDGCRAWLNLNGSSSSAGRGLGGGASVPDSSACRLVLVATLLPRGIAQKGAGKVVRHGLIASTEISLREAAGLREAATPGGSASLEET